MKIAEYGQDFASLQDVIEPSVCVWAVRARRHGIARSALESQIRVLGINKNRLRGRPAKLLLS
jgi:hypothetical protein